MYWFQKIMKMLNIVNPHTEKMADSLINKFCFIPSSCLPYNTSIPVPEYDLYQSGMTSSHLLKDTIEFWTDGYGINICPGHNGQWLYCVRAGLTFFSFLNLVNRGIEFLIKVQEREKCVTKSRAVKRMSSLSYEKIYHYISKS